MERLHPARTLQQRGAGDGSASALCGKKHWSGLPALAQQAFGRASTPTLTGNSFCRSRNKRATNGSEAIRAVCARLARLRFQRLRLRRLDRELAAIGSRDPKDVEKVYSGGQALAQASTKRGR